MKNESSGLGDRPARLGERQRLVGADRRFDRKAAPIELLQARIGLQRERQIEAVRVAVAPHRRGRLLETRDALDAGADHFVRYEASGESVGEIAIWKAWPAFVRFEGERGGLRGDLGGIIGRAAQIAPDRGQDVIPRAHEPAFRSCARYCSKKVRAAGLGKSR